MSIELETLERSTDLWAQPRPKLLSATEYRNINTFFSYNERAVACSNVNGGSKKTAIHLAVESLDTYAIKGLLRNEEININVKDDTGNTPLHLAVKLNRSKIVKIFLQRPDLRINDVNENGQTALHLALDHNYQKIAYDLLTEDGIDIDTPNPKYNGKSCREIIQEKFPEMYLITLLRNGKIDEFIALVNTNRYFLDRDDNRYTYYLKYACENSLKEVVKALLDLDVPNKCCDENIIFALQIAAITGHYKILEFLLKRANSTSFEITMATRVSLVYLPLMGAKESEYLHRSDEDCDFKQCLKLLLSEKDVISEINYNLDNHGKTIFDYASCLNDDDLVKMILRPPLYIGMENEKGKYPFTMIKSYIIEESLNSCIYTNNVMDSKNENYAIIFDFGMLIQPEINLSAPMPIGEMETNPYFMKKLMHVELGNRRPVLQHPLLMSYFHIKWCAVKPFFLNCVIRYGLMFFSLTSHHVYSSRKDRHLIIEHVLQLFHIFFFFFGFTFVYVKLAHLTNFCLVKKKLILGYFIIIITGFYVFFKHFTPMSRRDQKLSTIPFFIMLCVAYLSLLEGQMYNTGIFIKVFKIVSKNFLILLTVFYPLVITFAYSFYFLYSDVLSSHEKPNRFHTIELSFFKTFVMMAGGFNAESIPSESESHSLLGHIGHMVFLLFVFFVSVVLFNSLNGLAIGDIQAIKAEAKTIGIISTIELLALAEAVAFDMWGKTSLSTRRYIWSFDWPFRQSPLLLFSKILPDAKVYLYPNRNNTVITNSADCSLDPNNPQEFFFHRHNVSKMDPEIVKASMKILEERKEQHKEASLEDLLKEFHHKTEERFKNEYLSKLDKFESKSNTFQNEYSQKMDQFQFKLDTLQNEYSQKLDHFESKSVTFQHEYSQKMDHFESKLDTFQDEYSKKIDQFNTNMTKILNLLEHKS